MECRNTSSQQSLAWQCGNGCVLTFEERALYSYPVYTIYPAMFIGVKRIFREISDSGVPERRVQSKVKGVPTIK